jgi:hypothetical protein
VADALQSILDLVTRLGGAPAEPAAEEEQAAGSADEPVAGGAAPAGGAPGPRPLRTREDALRQIEEIAAFFRKTEPHSPPGRHAGGRGPAGAPAADRIADRGAARRLRAADAADRARDPGAGRLRLTVAPVMRMR